MCDLRAQSLTRDMYDGTCIVKHSWDRVKRDYYVGFVNSQIVVSSERRARPTAADLVHQRRTISHRL